MATWSLASDPIPSSLIEALSKLCLMTKKGDINALHKSIINVRLMMMTYQVKFQWQNKKRYSPQFALLRAEERFTFHLHNCLHFVLNLVPGQWKLNKLIELMLEHDKSSLKRQVCEAILAHVPACQEIHSRRSWMKQRTSDIDYDVSTVRFDISLNVLTIYKNGERLLIQAAKQGHHLLIKKLLEQGVDVDSCEEVSERRWSALHIAAFNGHEHAVETLLQYGASVHIQSEKGRTPLHLASRKGHLTITKILLEKGANPSTADEVGLTALHFAVKKGYPQISSFLLQWMKEDGTVNIDQGDKKGWSALHHAVTSGHFAIVKLLIKHGANIVKPEKSGWTPVLMAIDKGHKSITKFLVQVLKDDFVNHSSKVGWTPLHIAVQSKKMAIVRMLIHKGANVNAANKHKITPIWIAVNSLQHQIVELLINSGADVDGCCGNRVSPLNLAIRKKQEKIVSTLLEHGANVNQITKGGQTPLHLAARLKHGFLANELLEYGADINIKAENGTSALHVAIKHQSLVNVLVLMDYAEEHGHDLIRTLDINGWTPLHYSAQSGNVEITFHLIFNGAEKNKQDKNGSTAINLATISKRIEICKFLCSMGVNVNLADMQGRGPLHNAIRTKWKFEEDLLITVHLLLQHGAQVNAIDDKGWSPLHYAARNKYHRVARFLLENRALVNAQDHEGDTPLLVTFDKNDPLKYNSQELNILYFMMTGPSKKVGTLMRCTEVIEKGEKLCKILVEYGADIHHTSEKRNSILLNAVEHGATDLVIELITKGIDINIADSEGNTCIHKAVEKILKKMLTLLLSKGASGVNTSNATGKTPLHIAAGKGSDLVQMLINYGADKEKVDQNGQTPLFIAIKSRNLKCIKLLATSEESILFQDSCGKTPLGILLESSKPYSLFLDRPLHETVFELCGKTACKTYLEEMTVFLVNNYSDTQTYKSVTMGGENDLVLKNCIHYMCRKKEITYDRIYKILQIQKDLNTESKKLWNLYNQLSKNLGENREILAILTASDINTNEINEKFVLHRVIPYNNLESVQSLLGFVMNVNNVDSSGLSPVHVAASHGLVTILEELVKKGGDINAPDERYGWNPMMHAIHSGHKLTVQYFLENKCSISYEDNKKWNALHHAADSGNFEIFQMLLDKGMPVDALTNEGLDAFYLAARNGHSAIVKSLLHTRMKNIQIEDENGQNAIQSCCSTGNIETLRLLLKPDTCMKSQFDKNGNSLLNIAIQNNRPDIMEFLLQNFPDIPRFTANGKSVLLQAAELKQFEATQVLLKAGIYDQAAQALIVFASTGFFQGIDLLLNSSMKKTLDIIFATNEDGDSPLHLAAKCQTSHIWIKARTCYFLCKFGIQVNRKNRSGQTALHIVTEIGDIFLFLFLLKCGASVQCKDINGQMVLHTAAKHGSTEILKTTLIMGLTQVNIPDDQGLTALHVAAQNGHLDCVKILLKAGANRKIQDIRGNTALMLASAHGFLQPVQELYVPCVHNEFNNEGRNVFHLAALGGHLQVLEFLVFKACEYMLHVTDISGLTPIDLAKRAMHFEVANFITDFTELGKLPISLPDNRNKMMYFHTYDLLYYISKEVVVKVGEAAEIHEATNNFVTTLCKQTFSNNSVKPIMVGSAREGTRLGNPDEFDFLCPDLSIITSDNQLQSEDPAFQIVQFMNMPIWCSSAMLNKTGLQNICSATRFHKLFRDCIAKTLETYNYLNSSSGTLCCTENLHEEYLKQAAASALNLKWNGKVYQNMPVSVDLAPCVKVHGWPCDALPLAELMPGLDIIDEIFPDAHPHYYLVAKPPHSDSNLGKQEDAEFLWRIDFAHIENGVMRSLPRKLKNIYTGCKFICKCMGRLQHPKTGKPMFKPKSIAEYEVGDLVSSYRLKITCLNYVRETFFNVGETATEIVTQDAALEVHVMHIFDKLVGYLENGFLPSFVQPQTVNLLSGSKDKTEDILAAAQFAQDFVRKALKRFLPTTQPLK